jgi:hypothetical protein
VILVWLVMRVWRVHHQNDQRQCSYGVLRWVLVWISVCYIVFTIGPPSRWSLKESPCPQCDDCYCSSADDPLVSPLGEFHFSLTLQSSNKLAFVLKMKYEEEINNFD